MAGLQGQPFEDKRRVVDAIIEKIGIGNGKINMTLSQLSSSEELRKNQSGRGLGEGGRT